MAQSNIQYKQDTKNIWFPNQVEPIYDPTDPNMMFAFNMYWKAEKDRIQNGFYLANKKVYISGWLYWHTVYWKIAVYKDMGNGKKPRIIETPTFRDIDWILAQDIQACADQGKFYALVGARGFGKSITAASLSGREYTVFDNSQCVISAGAASYNKLVTDKIEDGLTNIHPIWKKNRLKGDWKTEVRAGWKDKNTNQPDPKSSNSHILIRNFEGGNNSMACNGTRPGFHLMDEIGTLSNLIGCYKDSDGCWWDQSGSNKPSAFVMITGTGGDMEVGAEAAEMFGHPSSYNLLELPNTWEGGVNIGRFIPASMGNINYKDEKSLEDYLGIKHPDLARVKIAVSDEDKFIKEWWTPKYLEAKKSGNSKTLLKFKAYWCLTPSDSFIVLTKNDFDVEAAKRQQNNIRDNSLHGIPVNLVLTDTGMVTHEFTDKLPITEFPVKTQEKDAPVVIYEFPMEEPPFGLYVAGVDPYRQSESEYSDSLGAIYIYKRVHEINSEKYQDMFVASYVARPGDIKIWNETARRLIRYYNARTLCENDEMSFIDYMINVGDGHYLEDTPDWLREISPNTSQLRTRKKGIGRSNKNIRNFLDGQYKQYLDDTIEIDRDENGSIIKEIKGVTRILDPMLLEETIRFDKDKNFDRIIAAQLAIALANKLNPIINVTSLEGDKRIQSYYSILDRSKNKSKSIFTMRVTGRKSQLRRSKLFM